MDYIEIGPVPASESCAQVGAEDYLSRSLRECEVFKRLLHRCFPIPEGLQVGYVIRTHRHDFGPYREVAVRFEAGDQAAVDFAYRVDRDAPDTWDAIARYELAWFDRRDSYARAVREGALPLDEVPKHYAPNIPPELPPGARFHELLASHPL